jgi:hypothetical protein
MKHTAAKRKGKGDTGERNATSCHPSSTSLAAQASDCYLLEPAPVSGTPDASFPGQSKRCSTALLPGGKGFREDARPQDLSYLGCCFEVSLEIEEPQYLLFKEYWRFGDMPPAMSFCVFKKSVYCSGRSDSR